MDNFFCTECGWHSEENPEERGWDHCPNCLCARHEIDEYGDDCGGTLEPVSIWVKSSGEWQIIQRCRLCGGMSATPYHDDDNRPLVLSIAARPLANPAFPLERIAGLTNIAGEQTEGWYDFYE